MACSDFQFKIKGERRNFVFEYRNYIFSFRVWNEFWISYTEDSGIRKSDFNDIMGNRETGRSAQQKWRFVVQTEFFVVQYLWTPLTFNGEKKKLLLLFSYITKLMFFFTFYSFQFILHFIRLSPGRKEAKPLR